MSASDTFHRSIVWLISSRSAFSVCHFLDGAQVLAIDSSSTYPLFTTSVLSKCHLVISFLPATQTIIRGEEIKQGVLYLA